MSGRAAKLLKRYVYHGHGRTQVSRAEKREWAGLTARRRGHLRKLLGSTSRSQRTANVRALYAQHARYTAQRVTPNDPTEGAARQEIDDRRLADALKAIDRDVNRLRDRVTLRSG